MYTKIKLVLTGVEGEGVNWIRLEQDTIGWRAVANTVINV